MTAEFASTGNLVEYNSACYCGDAHFRDWPATLDRLAGYSPKALVHGRGDAFVSETKVNEAVGETRVFLNTLFGTAIAPASVKKGHTLKETYGEVRKAMDPKFSTFAIYEHCLPFNVSPACDKARGIDHPVIWTADRDREMWAA